MGDRHTRYNAYDSFAWFFNRYWAGSFARDVRPILTNVLLPRLPSHGHILDLCCGTGQLSRWLRACGFRVTGLDASEEMIRLARRNSPDAMFLVADARSFAVPPVYDCVISTFDSLNHVPSAQDLLRVFQNVYQSLNDDGLFFFDVNMEEGFQATAPATDAVIKKTHVCIVESSYDTETRIGNSAITVFRLEKGAWRRSDFEIVEYCYPEPEVRSLLTEAGFGIVASWDAQRDLGMKRGIGRLFFLAAKGNSSG